MHNTIKLSLVRICSGIHLHLKKSWQFFIAAVHGVISEGGLIVLSFLSLEYYLFIDFESKVISISCHPTMGAFIIFCHSETAFLHIHIEPHYTNVICGMPRSSTRLCATALRRFNQGSRELLGGQL